MADIDAVYLLVPFAFDASAPAPACAAAACLRRRGIVKECTCT
jgi:hypothetical protein